MANNSEEYFLPHSVHLQFSLIPRLHEEADFRCARRALSCAIKSLVVQTSGAHQAGFVGTAGSNVGLAVSESYLCISCAAHDVRL